MGAFASPALFASSKEQDIGFDRAKLDRLEELLARQIVHRFPDRAYLQAVESVPKGSDVLLECADLIASAVRRRGLYDTRHAKDLVSAAVMKETGLEFHPNSGAVFKIHGVGPARG